jgi:hypothetical protein
VPGGTFLSVMVTPAALACSARTVAIATVPDRMGEVTSSTRRSSRPACRSRYLAWAMSVWRVRAGSKSGSRGELRHEVARGE